MFSTNNLLINSNLQVAEADLERGKAYLWIHCKVIMRQHDGYCSGVDYESGDDIGECKENFSRNEVFKHLWFSIPSRENESDSLDLLSHDGMGYVIRNEGNECLFEEWRDHSECGGSYYCCMYDTFIPLSIEFLVFA